MVCRLSVFALLCYQVPSVTCSIFGTLGAQWCEAEANNTKHGRTGYFSLTKTFWLQSKVVCLVERIQMMSCLLYFSLLLQVRLWLTACILVSLDQFDASISYLSGIMVRIEDKDTLVAIQQVPVILILK